MMTLKRRILVSILGSLVLCASLGGAFALVITELQHALVDGQRYVDKQKAASEAVATCFTELQYIAMRHLRDYDDKVGDEFVNKVHSCATSINERVQEGLLTNVQAQEFIVVIHKFEREVLELSGELRNASASLMRVHTKITELAHVAATSRRKTMDIRPLNDIALRMSASAMGNAAIDKDAVTAVTRAMRAQLGALDSTSRERIDDLLLDLEIATETWNKSLTKDESALVGTGKSFAHIPVSFSDSALNKMTQQLARPLGLVRYSLYGTIALFPLIALMGLFLTRWILKSWTRTMGLLKEMGTSIIQNSGNSTDLVQDLENESKAGHGDEVSVALDAMLQTFRELEDLKKSLEKKVEARTRDLKKTQNQLFQAEKLAGLGTLASGVAHELNNPLQVIRLGIESLEIADSAAEKKPFVEQCLRHVDRMSLIIAQLRRMARNSDGREEWAHLPTMYNNAMVLLGGRLSGGKVEITCDLPQDMEVKCEPMQFESLLSNLMSNAIDAVLMRKEPTSPPCIEITAQKAGKDLVLSIKDNGTGIPEEIKSRIFEPFFTSKDVGKGMGLGLSLSHKIALEHQAALTMESTAGKGSIFKLKLPSKRLRQRALAAA